MSRFSFIVRLLVCILLIGSMGSAGYFYYQYKQVQGGTNEAEAQSLREEVSEIMELPEEQPTVATVTDPAKLSLQPFFQKSQAGDKVLIFTTSKKAVLYRPSIKKIIDVSSIQSPASVTTPSTPSAMPTPSV